MLSSVSPSGCRCHEAPCATRRAVSVSILFFCGLFARVVLARALLAPVVLVLSGILFHDAVAAEPEVLLVSAWHGNTIARYDATTGEPLGSFDPDGQAELSRAHSVRLGPDGLVYVASFSGDKVTRFDPVTGEFVDDFVPAGTAGLSSAADALHGPDGDLFVASFDNDTVLRFDGDSGAYLGEFVAAGSGGLEQPELMTFGPNGNLFVSSRYAGILEFDGMTGDFVRVFVVPVPGVFDDLHVILFGPDGRAYVSSFENDEVRRFDATTGDFVDVFVAAGSGGLDRAHAMAFGIDGDFYVTSFATDQVLRYDGVSGAFRDVFVDAGPEGPNGPSHLLFVPVPALRLSSLEPGIAGSPSAITASGAGPGERVLFFRARRAGITPTPGCPDLNGLLLAPKLVRKLDADASGVATLTGTVPLSLSGRELVMQAIVKSSCRRSNVVKVRIP